MQVQSINNYSQQNNTNFGALKNIRCKKGYCSEQEKLIIDELKKLAKEHNFFKKHDVNAVVSVESWKGAEVRLESKPAAKTLGDRLRNFFAEPEVHAVKDTHSCPYDSTYFMARKLRDIRTNKESFLTIFTKRN